MQCSFIQTVPTWADAVCNIHADTHDGFDSAFKKRREEEGDSKQRLHDFLQAAFSEGVVEVTQVAEPYVERLESGRIEIDWPAIEGEVRVKLEALEVLEASRRELEQDEEDVMILLLH